LQVSVAAPPSCPLAKKKVHDEKKGTVAPFGAEERLFQNRRCRAGRREHQQVDVSTRHPRVHCHSSSPTANAIAPDSGIWTAGPSFPSLSSGLRPSTAPGEPAEPFRVNQAVRINNGFICHLPPAISHLICHQPWTPGPGKAILSSSRRPLAVGKDLAAWLEPLSLSQLAVPVPGPRPSSIRHPPSSHFPACLLIFPNPLFLVVVPVPLPVAFTPLDAPPGPDAPTPPPFSLVGLHHPPPSPAPSHQHGPYLQLAFKRGMG
jgi:hypothetical protein